MMRLSGGKRTHERNRDSPGASSKGLLQTFEQMGVASHLLNKQQRLDSKENEEKIVASVRAEGVAEALFELKRLNKLATFTQVATRAGFKPGAGGRTLMTCLAAVQRDWPHLHWWRAIPDDAMVAKESDHAKQLTSSGYAIAPAEGKKDMVKVVTVEETLFTWEKPIVA
jgi:hypothetical protein